MRLLTNADVEKVLGMTEVIRSLKIGYQDLAAGDGCYILRIDLFALTGRSEDYYQWGRCRGRAGRSVLSVRIQSDVVAWSHGRTEEKCCVRPRSHCVIILLLSIDDGSPLAVVRDGYLHHMRVGGSAALGTALLAGANAGTLGLIGSRGMSRTVSKGDRRGASIAVRACVQSHSEEQRGVCGSRAGRPWFGCGRGGVSGACGPGITHRLHRYALYGADIGSEFGTGGAHVNCTTRRESSSELVHVSDHAVQLGIASIPPGAPIPGIEWKTGSIAPYVSGQPEERPRIPTSGEHEIGRFASMSDVQLGRVEGRTAEQDITLFVNTGAQGLQLASVAGRVTQLGQQEDIGAPIPVDWSLQDICD